MPPRSTTGITKGSSVRTKTPGISPQGTGASIGKLRRLAIQMMTSIMAPAIRRPGTTPPRKSQEADAPETRPWSTRGIDGGIMGPMGAEAGRDQREGEGGAEEGDADERGEHQPESGAHASSAASGRTIAARQRSTAITAAARKTP